MKRRGQVRPHPGGCSDQEGDSASGPQRREGASVLPDAEAAMQSTLQATVFSRLTACTVPAFLLSLKALLRAQALLVFVLSEAVLYLPAEKQVREYSV